MMFMIMMITLMMMIIITKNKNDNSNSNSNNNNNNDNIPLSKIIGLKKLQQHFGATKYCVLFPLLSILAR